MLQTDGRLEMEVNLRGRSTLDGNVRADGSRFVPQGKIKVKGRQKGTVKDIVPLL